MDLIEQMLNFNPEKRLPLDELLEHQWMRTYPDEDV
jgi:serine/threonine protein kinase